MSISLNGGNNPVSIKYNNQTVNRVDYNGVTVWPDSTQKVRVNYSLMNYWYPEGGSSAEGKEYAYKTLVGIGNTETTQYEWIEKDTAGSEPFVGTIEVEVGKWLFFRGWIWTDETMVDPNARLKVTGYLNGIKYGNHGSHRVPYTFHIQVPDNISTVTVTTSCGETPLYPGGTQLFHTVIITVTTS